MNIKIVCFLIIINNLNSFATILRKTNSIFNINSSFKNIKKLCENRERVCSSNDTIICATRLNNGVFEYKSFNNSCYLFIANICEFPGAEFSITSSGICSQNNARREFVGPFITTTVKPLLRSEPLYEVDDAFDYHSCPLSCPDVYSPVCVGVNRGHGLYYKFFTFVNHCAGDLYYCKNWREFSPPPDETEMVRSSPLSWSFCAANRYIQFARFAEMTSSMGHYGWLQGDYRPTHIMRESEKLPGFG